MIKKTVIIFLILTFLFTTPVLAQTFSIKGYKYVPLWSVCKDNDIEFLWDSFGRIITLKKNNIEATLRVNSDKILIGDRLKDIGPPVRFYKDMVVVPKTFGQKKIQQIFAIPSSRVRKSQQTQKTSLRHRIKKIVIDPGHGGKDPGALGRYGINEKEIVLDIARRLKRALTAKGIKVILTRSKDVFIPLWKRSEIANKNKADFFISIHANSFRKKWARGFEVYFLADAADSVSRATEAAENNAIKFEKKSLNRYSSTAKAIACDLVLHEQRKESAELAEYIRKAVKRKIYIRDRGIKKAKFHVLKKTAMPAVLVEVGFLSNVKEGKLLKNSSHRQKIANAIAQGILSYKDKYEKANGFTK